jgi:hypothetical protein
MRMHLEDMKPSELLPRAEWLRTREIWREYCHRARNRPAEGILA